MQVEIFDTDRYRTLNKLLIIKKIKEYTDLGLREAKDFVDGLVSNGVSFKIEIDPKHFSSLVSEANALGVFIRGGRKNKIFDLFADERKEKLISAYLKSEHRTDSEFTFKDHGHIVEVTYDDDNITITTLDIMSWMFSKMNIE